MSNEEYERHGYNDLYQINKTPITVVPGDRITYSFAVYNEGSDKAKINEITDYYPTSMDEVNRSQSAYNEYKRKDINVNIQLDSKKSKEVATIVLEVNNTATKGDLLTNFAEISDYESANIVKINDIDSKPNNFQIQDKTIGESITERKNMVRSKSLDDSIDISNMDLTEFEALTIMEDDEDFEQVKVGNFDLALRKSIISITSDNQTTNYKRGPSDYIYSTYKDDTSISYKHYKKALEVQNGSKIKYRIRIYNEGFYEGTATKILDILTPSPWFV